MAPGSRTSDCGPRHREAGVRSQRMNGADCNELFGYAVAPHSVSDRTGSPSAALWHRTSPSLTPSRRSDRALPAVPDSIESARSASCSGSRERRRRNSFLEGQRARGHFVQHDTERKQIAARVERLAARLLRRHVGDGAQRRSRAGELPRRPRRQRRCTRRPRPVDFREAEVEHFARPARVMKILAGLMSRWTMPARCAASSASATPTPMASNASAVKRAGPRDLSATPRRATPSP